MNKISLSALTCVWCWMVCVLFSPPPSFAENGGAAIANAAARAQDLSVGGTVWVAGPHLVEPCTAEIICENVILTTVHCLNVNYKNHMYFSLAEDLNGLPGAGNRHTKVE